MALSLGRMAAYSTGDTVIFNVGSVLFLVHAAKVVKNLLAPKWRKGVCEAFARLAQLLHSRLWVRGGADEFTEEVEARLMAWQLSQFQEALKVLLYFLTTPIMFFSFYNVIMGRQRIQTDAQDILIVVGYAALLLADWCPWLVNAWSLDIWYASLMVGLALFIVPPFCAREYLLEAVLIAKMLAALLSLGRMSLRAVVLGCLMHMSFEFWTLSVMGKGMAMNFWFIWPLMLSVLIGKIQARVKLEMRKDIESKAIQDRQSACDALSAMFYDVVVELDRNLCIAADTPKLAAFLLRSTHVPLERTPFEDLLQDEEDRARLRDLLCPAGCPEASSFVELAHARMLGGHGTVVQVELFGYRFRGPCGLQRYLVGVREAGDFNRGGVPLANAGPQTLTMSPFDDVSVVVDPHRTNMPILSCTPFFNLRIMPVAEGTCLTPAVVKGARFEAWVQTAVSQRSGVALYLEEGRGEPPAESFVVTFRPRGRNNPMRTRALCKLKVMHSDDYSWELQDGQIAVELSFSSITMLQMPRALQRADSVSSSSSNSSMSSTTSVSGSVSGTPNASLRLSLGGRAVSGRPTVYGARASL